MSIATKLSFAQIRLDYFRTDTDLYAAEIRYVELYIEELLTAG